MFAKIITVACAFASLAQAVSKASRVEFTKVPGPAITGQNNTIEWNQGSGDPVTIILRQGDPDNLSTIGIIASNVKGNSFSWVPSSTLKPSDDYALEITQDDTSNYSGLFSLVDGSTASATTVLVAAGSTTFAVTTLAPNTTSATGTITSALTNPLVTGTGVPVSRNTTFSSQTLSASSTGGGIISGAGTITPTPTAGAGGSTSAAATPSQSTGAASSAFKAQGAMGFGALVAALFML